MKKTLIALAALAFVAAAQAEYLHSTSSSGNGVLSQSGAYAASNGNGASFSFAGNKQTSGAVVSSTVGKSSLLGSTGYSSTEGSGFTTTKSFAGNISLGNATGFAGAGGQSVAHGTGNTSYDLHGSKPEGYANGSFSSSAGSLVESGRNGFGVANGGNQAGFSASSWAYQAPWGIVNKAETNAAAHSVSNQFKFDIGNATAQVGVGGQAGADSAAKSGKAISSN